MRTRLGEGGVLSAGQEQLVAFARSWCVTRMVILDEATARLDPVTEVRSSAPPNGCCGTVSA
jgi:ABC-type multidrug transport system fused ATPase/permease subunit